MSAILIPDATPGAGKLRPPLRLVGEPNPGVSARRTRRTRAAPVVPTDCTTCLSAGSVRRGICDICGAVVVD